MRELMLTWSVSEQKQFCGLLVTNLAAWHCAPSSFWISLLRYGSVMEDTYSSLGNGEAVFSLFFSLSAAWSAWLLHDRSTLIVLPMYLAFAILSNSLSFFGLGWRLSIVERWCKWHGTSKCLRIQSHFGDTWNLNAKMILVSHPLNQGTIYIQILDIKLLSWMSSLNLYLHHHRTNTQISLTYMVLHIHQLNPLLYQMTGFRIFLSNLNVKKVSGPQNTSCRILRELSMELAPVLTAIYTQFI